MKSETSRKIIGIWLWTGFIMILMQIFLGGITRLTGSGLSITRWDIITGILYPMSEDSWTEHFELYKQTPQYQKINQDMNLNQFKFIFFWEYIHRLWARLMGLVFLIPLIYFITKKWIDKILFRRLIIIFLLACLVASLGWIMVASGLTKRPWVNAYKLSFHLIAAVGLLVFLFNTILTVQQNWKSVTVSKFIRPLLSALLIMLGLQIFLGGIMSGMKAGLSAPTWPLINGKWIPDQLYQISSMEEYLFEEYELSHSGPVVIQFFHRMLAYLIFFTIMAYCYLEWKQKGLNRRVFSVGLICFLQLGLGIWTLIHCVGMVPLWPAVFHQVLGILLLIYSVYLYRTSETGTMVLPDLKH